MLKKLTFDGKKIKIALIMVVFISVLTGWAAKRYVFPNLQIKNNVRVTSNKQDLAYYSDIYHSDNGEVISEDDPYCATILKNKFTVKGVSVEQEITSEEKSAIMNSSGDLNDSLMNGYSIVCVSLEIESQRTKEELLTPNINKINVLSGDSTVTSATPFLMKPYQYSPANSQHFHVTLQPEEITQIQLYYCIKNEYLNGDYTLQFYLNPSGLNEKRLPEPNADPSMYFAKMNLNTFIFN